MNPIRQWLNDGRDYSVGLALYEVYGQDTLLLEALRQGRSTYRHERMVTALRALIHLAERTTAAVAPAEPSAPTAALVDKVELPEVMVAAAKDTYREQWMPFYQEMNRHRASLLQAADDKARGALAHRVLECERICMMWWERRDYLLRTGQELAPELPAAPVVTDHNKLQRRLLNLRTYITKHRKRLPVAEDQMKVQALIDQYEAEAAEITKQLGL